MWGTNKPKAGLVGFPSGISVSVPDCSIMSQDVSGNLRYTVSKYQKSHMFAIVCEFVKQYWNVLEHIAY